VGVAEEEDREEVVVEVEEAAGSVGILPADANPTSQMPFVMRALSAGRQCVWGHHRVAIRCTRKASSLGQLTLFCARQYGHNAVFFISLPNPVEPTTRIPR
jgi:hypothetical protein